MTGCCPTCGQALPPDTITIDREAGIVVAGGRFAALTELQFDVFETLWDAPGRTMRRETMHDRLYQLRPDDPPEMKIIDVVICHLRKKLAGTGIEIKTLWGRGYRVTLQEGKTNDRTVQAEPRQEART